MSYSVGDICYPDNGALVPYTDGAAKTARRKMNFMRHKGEYK